MPEENTLFDRDKSDDPSPKGTSRFLAMIRKP
jgi:hypothetical protein